MTKVDLKGSLVFGITLPFIVFLVSPVAFYLGNHREYPVALTDVVVFLLALTASGAGIGAALLLGMRRWPMVHGILSGVLIGLAAAAWVQSQLFAWNFGPLDGRGIPWNEWDVHAGAELVVWVCLISAAVALACRSQQALVGVAQGVLLVGTLTIISSWISSDYQVKQSVDLSQNQVFTFHEQHNTLLIILDTFQGDVFQEIARRWPAEVEFLRGFVFYPNALGGYPTTLAAVPLIITGNFYKNDIPVREWIRANNARQNIADYFAGRNYGVSQVSMPIDTLDGVKAPKSSMAELGDERWAGISKLQLLVLDGGIFRVLPTTFKPDWYDEGNWYFTQLAKDVRTPPGVHGIDWRFLRAFERNASIGSVREREFKYYHYIGAHWPLQVNEYFQYEKGMPPTRESYVRQARGVLAVLRRKLEAIKRLGIYDAAEILVVGDHGSHKFLPMDIRGLDTIEGEEKDIGEKVLASSRPLFLYKPDGSAAPLTHSEVPVHLADVVCLLSKEDAAFACENSHLRREGEARKRKFFYYYWGKEYHDGSKEYMPPMTEYMVKGDVRDIGAWSNTYVEYAEGAHKLLPRSATYRLGDRITFTLTGNSKDFVKQGWSEPEATHRWTQASRSRLVLQVKETKAKPLTLRLHARAFPARGVAPQHVEIFVNGQKIAAWQMLQLAWYEAPIPAEVVGEGLLNIVFGISDPTAPCNLTDSNDCRKLGLAAQEMLIIRQGDKG